MTTVQHVVLDVERYDEGRHRVADDAVVRRPRRDRNRLVPDLAESGVVPADQAIIGPCRAGGGKRGQGNGGGGAKHGNATHGVMAPVGKYGLILRKLFCESLLSGGDIPDMNCSVAATNLVQGR